MAPLPSIRYACRVNPTVPVDSLKYLAIPEEVAIEAREKKRDRFGHEVEALRDTGPCRVCLRIASEPEDLLLLSYQPLPDTGPYAEIGPIFVHAKRCEPYSDSATFPADFTQRRLVLRAYGHDGRIVDATVAEAGTAPERAVDFLSGDTVAEVHVRHESYTCFAFKIVRGS
jgi:hypothetical protein